MEQRCHLAAVWLTWLGLRSVPVLEADGRQLVGNATSEQIAEFLRAGVNGQDLVRDA